MSSDQISLSSALSACLAAMGVDIERVGQLAGLPGGLFSQRHEKVKLSTRQFFDIWRALAQLTNDPAFGLHLGGDICQSIMILLRSLRCTPPLSGKRCKRSPVTNGCCARKS